MKISVIITTILVAQVSASFFDVFQGAVLSVQNSFGKLLSDVVTDVKDTVDCTILAVEHVLSLSHDATTRYYDKCSSGTNKTDSVSEAPQDVIVPKVEVTLNLPNNNEEYLQKVIPAEIDAKIDERLSKVLGNYKPHDNALNIQNVLAKESEQLAGVSVLVKKELEKLSNAVATDLKNIEKQRESQPSVDTILQEIKVLEQRERNTKNTSEAKEIHKAIDQILGKLHAIEATEEAENVELEEILTDLEMNSNNSFGSLRHQFEEWKEEEARHLNEIKSKIEEHETISAHHHLSHTRHGSDQMQPVLLNIEKNTDDVEYISNSPETSSKNITLFIEALNNSTSSRTFAGSNDRFIIPVADKTSFSENKELEDSGQSDTLLTSYSYYSNKNLIGRDVFQTSESPTAFGSSDLSSFTTNEFTINANTLTGDDTKLPVTDTTLPIQENKFVNESIQLVASMDSDKQQKLTTNETTSILSSDENNSTQIVIPIQTPNASIFIKTNTDPGKEELADVTKSYTVVGENETELISTSQNNDNSNSEMNSSTPNQMVQNPFRYATDPENEASTILPSYELTTTRVVSTFDDMQPTDAIITSTSPAFNAGLYLNETIVTSGDIEPVTVTSTIVNDSNETKVTSSSSPTVQNSQVSETIQPIETTSTSSKEESSTTVVHDNNTKGIITTTTFLPIVETTNTPQLENIQTYDIQTNSSNNTTISSDSLPVVENTTIAINVVTWVSASGNEESLGALNESIIASTPLTIVDNTPLIDSVGETIAVSNNEEPTEAVSELITTLKIENNSYITVTSTPIQNVKTFESETIDDIATTTVSSGGEETLHSYGTETSNIGVDDVDDSSATVITSTISERIIEENVEESESDKSVTSTSNSPIASPATLIDSDSDTDLITITIIPIQELTNLSEVIYLESTTSTENEEPLMLSKPPVTNTDEVTNEITEAKDNVTSYTENTDSTVVTESTQTFETTTGTKAQDFSSTSTLSTTNELLTTSVSEKIMSSKSDLDLGNSTTMESNASTEIPDIPTLNVMIKSPPLEIIESSPENREKLTPNKLNQQNYNTNTVPRNYDFNAPISLSDPSLQTRQPLMNPDGVPLYSQPAMPPITRGAFNEAQRQEEAFAVFDSIDKRISHSDSPFGPDDDIPKANIPSTPLLANVPWKPIDPQRMNFHRPQGLTTHRPRNANYYKNPSIDYDSFFHSPRNSEAHQRALKEALQIMANSKQSERIINSVIQNKNKFNARTIFNG